ncbi:MAG TPA: rhomboid family intramembrane serine protease [Anaeromyxobacteraceae bacterium]|nr:rhomboid family intramembrane serine protease [Anaeromyxobacteraceae bacterium]
MFPLKDDLPVHRTPVVTWVILAANVLAFLWQVGVVGLEYSVYAGGAIPYEILRFRDLVGGRQVPDLVRPPLTVFTSMFLHGGWGHIFSNMLFLWIFGNNVEDALGRGRFLFFYLASGVAAALAQTAATAVQAGGLPPAEARAALAIPMVGASGAIAGVLAAYMILFPQARILTLVPIFIIIRLFYIPARVFIGLWFLLQLLMALGGVTGAGGVAFFAHIGGFVAGLVLVKITGRRRVERRPAEW